VPYCEDKDSYHEVYEQILANESLSKESKDYIKKRHVYREKWVKAYMKNLFTGGTCTTSRIESKHRIYKSYLNSESSLVQLFRVFDKLEEGLQNYNDEIETINNRGNDFFSKSDLIKKIEEVYSPYICQKIKPILLNALNYDVQWIYKPKK